MSRGFRVCLASALVVVVALVPACLLTTSLDGFTSGAAGETSLDGGGTDGGSGGSDAVGGGGDGATAAHLSFQLIDLAMGTPVDGYDPLPSEVTLSRAFIKGVTMEALSDSPMTRSIVFVNNGNVDQIENTPPYTISGGVAPVNNPWFIFPGPHEIAATAYDAPDGMGEALGTATIKVIVTTP